MLTTETQHKAMMGLQTTANKRKHEMIGNNENDDHSNFIPLKTSRYSKLAYTPTTATPNEVSIRMQSLPSVISAPSENSIAKLEAVAIPGETWSSNHNTAEQSNIVVDSIQRLQAVTVPGERWINECSTLAATLLGNDLDDDDDDDFEDDFEENEPDIPNFPIRRYQCGPPHGYVPPGYPKGFGYYNESYPQQNCCNIKSHSLPHSQHRLNNNSSYYGGWNHHHYYNMPEQIPSSNTQQTIRCAENGKSYLELGSANYNSNANLNLRHHKHCCDSKSNLCNTRQCYKERRLKIMNLSMFKLSRFRQISEQSLYRSVLICNTLKLIEKEIENESKENISARISSANERKVSNNITSNNNQLDNNCSNNNCNNNNLRLSNNGINHHPLKGPYENRNNIIPQETSPATNGYVTTPVLVNKTFNSNDTNTTTTVNQYEQQIPQNPFRDMNSGRATPFPSILELPDTDSGYGGDDDCSSKTINWGSVLSLSSQSATDPLNNNDFYSSINNYITSNTATAVVSPQPSYWDCNIFDSDLGLDKSDLTELLPSWKLTPLSADDILKSVPPPKEPSKIMYDSEIDNFTHIMVGS